MAGAHEEAKFTHGNLMRHVSVMSFTASIGLMAIFAVDFVDMIFISMLGNAALAAAVGYAGTLLFFTSSISIGMSIAAGALVARSIGAGDQKDAKEFATSVLMIGAVLCLIVVGLIFFNMRPLLGMLGASGETLDLAVSYLSIILPTMPVLMAAMVCGAVLRAHGDAKRATMATLFGGIANAIFDPLLIFGLGWGLEGAAVASVIARVTILVVSIRPVITIYDGLASPRLDMLARDLKPVFGIAAPAVLANVATPVGSAVVTREMAKFGTDAVAAMAIIGRLTPVAFAVIFALSGAIGPIVGQNFGAGLRDRVRGAFLDGLKFVAIYVVVVALILFLLRSFVADIFDAEGLTRNLVYLFCGPLALAGIFNGWIFVGNATFNNLGYPIYSTWINWGRNTLGMWPPVLLGSAWFGASGVLIGQAVGGVIFAVISVWLALRVMEREGGDDATHHFRPHLREHVVSNRRH